jgi:hypothetical protein
MRCRYFIYKRQAVGVAGYDVQHETLDGGKPAQLGHIRSAFKVYCVLFFLFSGQ